MKVHDARRVEGGEHRGSGAGRGRRRGRWKQSRGWSPDGSASPSRERRTPAQDDDLQPSTESALPRGIAHRTGARPGSRPRRGRPSAGLHPSQVDAEVERFGRAVEAARLELRAVKARIPEGTPREIAAFIDTHLLMLDDEAISKAPRQLHPRDAMQRPSGRSSSSAMRSSPSSRRWTTRTCARARMTSSMFVNRVQNHLQGGRAAMSHSGASRRRQNSLRRRPDPGRHRAHAAPGSRGVHDRVRWSELAHRHSRPQSEHSGSGGSCIAPRSLLARWRRGCAGRAPGRRHRVPRPTSSGGSMNATSEKSSASVPRAASCARTPTVTADGEPVVLQANVELPGESAGAVRDGAGRGRPSTGPSSCS